MEYLRTDNFLPDIYCPYCKNGLSCEDIEPNINHEVKCHECGKSFNLKIETKISYKISTDNKI